MAPVQSRQVLIWSVPTIAILLSFLWFKHRRGTRRDPGGQSPCKEKLQPEELNQEEEEEGKKDKQKSVVVQTPVTPIKISTSRSLSGVETAPIDIKSAKSPPLVISDKELDLEIEKLKSMKTVNCNATPSPVSVKTKRNKPVKNSPETKSISESSVTSQIIPDETNRDSANHSPSDAMLVSPSSFSLASDGHHSDSDSGKGGSDMATPPPPQATQTPQIRIHEFVIPQQLVGRLIGRHGAFVHQIKDKTNARILIKKHPELNKSKVCAVEGIQSEIDAALDMIREKFPEKKYPDVTLEHVVFEMPIINTLSLAPECMHLKLIEGINNDTIVSCMVMPNHLFLQQPTHPTFPNLNVLSTYMNACYADPESPLLPIPIKDNTICAAHSIGAWYRAMVLSSDTEAGTSHIKFLDYGGYATVDNSMLRQIRGDFLLLPFQAAECILANIQPVVNGENEEETWPQEAYDLVAELTKGAVIFTQVVDYIEDTIPLVHIYIRGPSNVIFLNRELVRRGMAQWVESDTS